MSKFNIVTVDDFTKVVGNETIERIKKKARSLRGCSLANVNATYYGGGVAELLSSMTLLMNSLRIKAEWLTITGSPDFFNVTKKMHNALQGGEINLNNQKKRVYEQLIYENSVRTHLDHDYVVIHDPQPLPLITHYKKKGPWIWRCHIDLTKPDDKLWKYLLPFIERHDAVVMSIPEYAQKMQTPIKYFMPAINPFSLKNRELSEKEMDDRLKRYNIPTDLPLVVQVSRFDRWKDPEGVIKAYKKARKEVDCTLVLIGNAATDDPEGKEVFESILGQQEDRILILSCGDDTALINALQKRAAVVMQKSIREGFGLTVTEALWKGTPVIGGKCGGIPSQITDGYNGFLVSSVDEAAAAMVKVLKDETLRRRMGKNARETVRQKFLMTRLLEEYVDLMNSFEAVFHVRG